MCVRDKVNNQKRHTDDIKEISNRSVGSEKRLVRDFLWGGCDFKKKLISKHYAEQCFDIEKPGLSEWNPEAGGRYLVSSSL